MMKQIQPQVCNRIQKSLEAEFSECDSVDALKNPISPSRPYHSSMEGGLDDYKLLQMGSPKVEENKENTNDFVKPRIPTPKKPRIPECMIFGIFYFLLYFLLVLGFKSFSLFLIQVPHHCLLAVCLQLDQRRVV